MNKMEINNHTKILVPASSYSFKDDRRILIPFTSGEKIGFMNQNQEIVVQPRYMMYYGDCYCSQDYIKVALDTQYGFARKNGTVTAYHRPVYGLIDYQGKVIFEPIYYNLLVADNKELVTVNHNYKYAVLDLNGKEIVPFGKYTWIDGFDNGLARVKVGQHINSLAESGSKWGIINEKGEEVLPVEYDSIWNFYGKHRRSTRVIKSGVATEIFFQNLAISRPAQSYNEEDNVLDFDDYGTHYGEFAGSYAQDVMGYSDDVINDAFEGDPDAYWNID